MATVSKSNETKSSKPAPTPAPAAPTQKVPAEVRAEAKRIGELCEPVVEADGVIALARTRAKELDLDFDSFGLAILAKIGKELVKPKVGKDVHPNTGKPIKANEIERGYIIACNTSDKALTMTDGFANYGAKIPVEPGMKYYLGVGKDVGKIGSAHRKTAGADPIYANLSELAAYIAAGCEVSELASVNCKLNA